MLSKELNVQDIVPLDQGVTFEYSPKALSNKPVSNDRDFLAEFLHNPVTVTSDPQSGVNLTKDDPNMKIVMSFLQPQVEPNVHLTDIPADVSQKDNPSQPGADLIDQLLKNNPVVQSAVSPEAIEVGSTFLDMPNRYEAAVANPLLRLMGVQPVEEGQEMSGNQENGSLLDAVVMGLGGMSQSPYGDRQAQLGDVLRAMNAPEPVAATGGLLAAASPLMPLTGADMLMGKLSAPMMSKLQSVIAGKLPYLMSLAGMVVGPKAKGFNDMDLFGEGIPKFTDLRTRAVMGTISDKFSKFTRPEAVQPGTMYPIEQVMKHDKLFEVYPKLKNLKVVFDGRMGGDAKARIDLEAGVIKLNNGMDPKNMHGSILHELQHAVQYYENFPRGYNARQAYMDELYEAHSKLKAQYEKLAAGNDPDRYAKMNAIIQKANNLNRGPLSLRKKGAKKYLLNHGEVIARSTALAKDDLYPDPFKDVSNGGIIKDSGYLKIKQPKSPNDLDVSTIPRDRSKSKWMDSTVFANVKKKVRKIVKSFPQSFGAGKIPKQKAYSHEEAMKKTDELIKIISGDPDKFPTVEGSPIVANADYGWAFVPNPTCRKGKELTNRVIKMRDYLDEALPKSMSKKGRNAIKTAASRKLFEAGFVQGLETPCLMCYTFEKQLIGYQAKPFSPGSKMFKPQHLEKALDDLKKVGIFRGYGTGDFAAQDIPSLVSLGNELKRHGVGFGTYTKNLNFLEIFGDTGFKFNVSTASNKAFGLPLDVVEPYLKRYKNATAVFIATSEEDLLKHANDPRIGAIIPLHLGGGTPAEFLKKLSGVNIKNFSKVQSEKIGKLVLTSSKIKAPKRKLREAIKMIKRSKATRGVNEYFAALQEASGELGKDIIPMFATYKDEPWYNKLIGVYGGEYGKTPEIPKLDMTKVNYEKAREYMRLPSVDSTNEANRYAHMARKLIRVAKNGGVEAIENIDPKMLQLIAGTGAYAALYGMNEEDNGGESW